MLHKKTIEALHRTLKVLLSGDVRHILPVIPRSTPADELYASLTLLFLCRHLGNCL